MTRPSLHSAAAVARCPWSPMGAPEPDLRFAALRTVENAAALRRFCDSLIGLLKELASRMRGLSAALRLRQKDHVKKVAGDLSFGLVTAFVILMAWPDWKLPQRFVA